MHVRQSGGGGIFKLHDYPVFLVGPHHSRNVMRVNLKFIYHTPKKKQQKKTIYQKILRAKLVMFISETIRRNRR